MIDEDRVTSADLRNLRRRVNDLADAVDALVDELDAQTPGDGPPQHAQAARETAGEIREQTPVVPGQERVAPPWEREGYSSKRAWLEDRQ